MKLIKVSVLISVLLMCSFSSHAGGGKQETRDWFETLRSVDGHALQVALRIKTLEGNLILTGRETLAFLRGISRVKVSYPQLREYGLTEDAVKTGIELRLRRNGIKVYDVPVDPNDFGAFLLSHPGVSDLNTADLSLTIGISFQENIDVVVARMELYQNQTVNLLSAEKPTFLLAKTWCASHSLASSRQNVAQRFREAIDELVDMYCNDWLATHVSQGTDLPR